MAPPMNDSTCKLVSRSESVFVPHHGITKDTSGDAVASVTYDVNAQVSICWQSVDLDRFDLSELNLYM